MRVGWRVWGEIMYNEDTKNDDLSILVNTNSFVQLVENTRDYLIYGFNDKRKMGTPIIIVGNTEKIQNNIYFQKAISKLDFCYDPNPHFYNKTYKRVEGLWWNCCKTGDYENKTKLYGIINYLNTMERFWCTANGCIHPPTEIVKLSIVFWNLFLCAIDEEVYNTQLCRVVELAHSFKLNENIMSDLCGAVEQLLSNQKLEAIFDIHYSTEECTNFFFKK